VEEGNTRDGYGVKLFEDGCLYAGDFEGGQRSGFGVQRWPTGHVYIGLWKHDKREGEGEYRLSYGDTDGSGVIEDGECDVYKVTLHHKTTAPPQHNAVTLRLLRFLLCIINSCHFFKI
jgi:hypothetical protein